MSLRYKIEKGKKGGREGRGRRREKKGRRGGGECNRGIGMEKERGGISRVEEEEEEEEEERKKKREIFKSRYLLNVKVHIRDISRRETFCV